MAERNLKKEIQEKLQDDIMQSALSKFAEQYPGSRLNAYKDQNIEELADLLEVVHAAALARGYTLEELEQVRAEKAAKRGSFEKRILLKEVYED